MITQQTTKFKLCARDYIAVYCLSSLSFPVETTAYSFIDALHLIFMDLPCTKHCSKKYGSNTDNEFTHVFQILC